MIPVPRSSLVDQTALVLRGEVLAGRWPGKLPGVCALAAECGVSHPVMRAALRQLEEEGLLVAGGEGRSRSVARDAAAQGRRSLRVMILLEVPMCEQDAAFQLVLLHLQASLEANGHVCRFAPRSLRDLRHEVGRVRRLVANLAADAWVVVGATEETLRWFAAQPQPAIAIGGRCLRVPIASTGIETLDALCAAVRHLTKLGHRRVVFLFAHALRKPAPSRYLLAVGEELAACGVPVGPYNFPDWDEKPEGLWALLDNLFRVTPPTAFVVQNSNWLAGVLSFVNHRGLQVPQDVSVVSGCFDHTFPWLKPSMAHLRSDEMRMAERVTRWIGAIARGRQDRKCVPCPASFVTAGSIGPPPRRHPPRT